MCIGRDLRGPQLRVVGRLAAVGSSSFTSSQGLAATSATLRTTMFSRAASDSALCRVAWMLRRLRCRAHREALVTALDPVEALQVLWCAVAVRGRCRVSSKFVGNELVELLVAAR